MPVVVEKPDTSVQRLRVQVDSEWVEHNFGRKVDAATARARLDQIVDAILPKAKP